MEHFPLTTNLKYAVHKTSIFDPYNLILFLRAAENLSSYNYQKLGVGFCVVWIVSVESILVWSIMSFPNPQTEQVVTRGAGYHARNIGTPSQSLEHS